jgi:hypothetical protein
MPYMHGESAKRRSYKRDMAKLRSARELVGDVLRHSWSDEPFMRGALIKAEENIGIAILHLTPEAPTEEFEEAAPLPDCAACGAEMQEVRPGKIQCPRCE